MSQDYVRILLKASVIYVFLVVTFRLMGKRTLGRLTAFDLIVTIIMGRVAAEPILRDTSIPQTMFAILVLGGLHYVNAFLGFLSPAFDLLIGGEPRLVIEDGLIKDRALRLERVSEYELQYLLREHEIEELGDIKRAFLEPDGRFSVIRTEDAKTARRRDLKELARTLGANT